MRTEFLGSAREHRWENHVFRRLRRFPTQKLACLQRVKAISIVPTKDPRSIPRCFCCFDDIANGLSCVDRVQHALMCVGMKLPTEADFVFCFIFQKASRASRCFWPPLSKENRAQHMGHFVACPVLTQHIGRVLGTRDVPEIHDLSGDGFPYPVIRESGPTFI